MWIRSQDKTKLIKCSALGVKELNTQFNEELIKALDVAKEWGVQVQCYVIGIYSTKAKALKVLDMIEQAINQTEEFKAQGENVVRNIYGSSSERLQKFTFQMPQDYEVDEDE